jgi:oligoendopeptidase F
MISIYGDGRCSTIGKMTNVGQNRDMYIFNFERNFFSSTGAEKAERDRYYKTLDEFENLGGKVGASADHLLRALQLYENVMVEFIRQYTFNYLHYAVNTTDLASKAIYSRMDAEFAQRTAFLRQELIYIDRSVLDRFIEKKPELEAYRFAVESAQRYRPHTLSMGAESTLSSAAVVSNEWEYELYEILVQRTSFGSVTTQEGELDVLRQRTAISTHPDRAIRADGFKQLYAGYASQRDLYAYTLINLVKRRNRFAKIHQFEDAPSEVYFNSYWSKAEVTNLLKELGQQAGVYLVYQRLRAEHARKILGVEDVDLWDVTMSLPGEVSPRFSIEQATNIICEALSAFGADYGRELASLLDPANGRIDILPGDHRKAGGFSKGFPGVTTVFFSHGFEGYYNDMRVLMHESTHAIHRQLMNNHAVRSMYAEGPHYLFESFAILNELLLADYLYQHETNRLKRQYYLEQFLDGKGMALFFIAQDASLEQSIYEEVENGSIESADDLDSLTKRILSRFDIWTNRHAELNMRWITNRLFYEDPLYDINYVYGALLALKYYELFTQSPASFVKNYISLLGNGFDATPEFLLSKFLKIDIHDPGLVADAVNILENKVRLLKEEYSNE